MKKLRTREEVWDDKMKKNKEQSQLNNSQTSSGGVQMKEFDPYTEIELVEFTFGGKKEK